MSRKFCVFICCVQIIILSILILLVAFAGYLEIDRSEGAEIFKFFAISFVLLSPFGFCSFVISKSLVFMDKLNLFLPGHVDFINSRKALLFRFFIWDEVKERIAARGSS
jgi:hypothetical protein